MTNSEILEKLKYTLPEDKNHFNCAISFDVMDEPVIDPRTLNPAALQWLSASPAERALLDYGNFKDVPRYDRKILKKIIGADGTGKSPSTRLLFLDEELIPDMALKFEINLFIEQLLRSKIEDDAKRVFSNTRFFFSRRAPDAASTPHIHPDAVNSILQQVVYGEESAVKAALEAVKSNAAQLSALLSATGTVKDYSNRTITGMTLLQAAAAAGDIDMCLMLKDYMPAEEFSVQLCELFPFGPKEHDIEQRHNAFNFDAIFEAILTASIPDLHAAFKKQDNGSRLCAALEDFRRQFTEISHREKIFNPHHLLRAYQVYIPFWDQCEREGDRDRDETKRNLAWCQIIGYVQRFVPACYAQAFVQGLCSFVEVDACETDGFVVYEDWHPEALVRSLSYETYPISYFSSGLGFDFAAYAWRGCYTFSLVGSGNKFFPGLQKFVSSKNSWLSEHYREIEYSDAIGLMSTEGRPH